MESNLNDWVNLLTRWIHLIAGISWIGNSFYFMWLDKTLAAPEPSRSDVEGELWMVHSGGFYQVEKRLIKPGGMPKLLHWFKWEATFTWISGFCLLVLMYHMTKGVYLVDPAISSITPVMGTVLSLALLPVGWFIYDILWKSPLGARTFIAGPLSFALLMILSWWLSTLISGRAMFIHIGAILGTIMVVNVWVRILPAQQAMINATAQGKRPDYELGRHAKRRSVHNSYMTLPVLFVMLSNHYPRTYGHPRNWAILGLLFVLGAAVRHVMIAGFKRSYGSAVLAAGSLVVMVFMTADPKPPDGQAHVAVSFSQVEAVIRSRCIVCHSQTPVDTAFGPSPGGVHFDNVENIEKFAERINIRVVASKTMPLGNKTGMTQEERDLIGQWVEMTRKE